MFTYTMYQRIRYRFYHFLLLFLTSSIVIIYCWHTKWLLDTDYPNNNSVIDQQHSNPVSSGGRIFCWILTSHLTHDDRVPAINDTWPKRCDHYAFYTDRPMNTTYPHATVFASIPDGMPDLWTKTRRALKFTYDHFADSYDWFVKADDDTYMIVENLRRLLNEMQPQRAHYLGFRLRPYLDGGYNAGGSGYVLSRTALKLFVDKLYSNRSICDVTAPFEDVQLAVCFEQIGIYPQDTRDQLERERFNTYRFEDIFDGKVKDNGDPKKWLYYPIKKGFDAISQNAISFHQLTPIEIRLFDLLLYRIQH